MIDAERRRFERIPLAIPVFLRGVDQGGKSFLDLTVALNISAGGALLASLRALDNTSKVTLMTPTVPVPMLQLAAPGNGPVRARVVRSVGNRAYNLYGVRFTHPLRAKSPANSPAPKAGHV